MLVERRMALVVEVVQQGDVAPGVHVLPEVRGVGAHRRLDREGVPQQRLVLRPLGEERPGRVAVVHEVRSHGGGRYLSLNKRGQTPCIHASDSSPAASASMSDSSVQAPTETRT